MPADPLTTAAAATPAPLLVDERTAARMLSVCPRTIFSLAKCGLLHPIRIGGANGCKRYSVADLQRYIAEAQGRTP